VLVSVAISPKYSASTWRFDRHVERSAQTRTGGGLPISRSGIDEKPDFARDVAFQKNGAVSNGGRLASEGLGV